MIFCSDLFLLNLLLPLPSSVLCRASAGLWPGREQVGQEEQLGLQRDRRGNVSLPRTSCLVSPWYDQTCTVSGPAPGSSAASLWPFCCPQTCHLEWLLDSGYGSCRDKAEGGYAREPQHRVGDFIITPVPQLCQFPLDTRRCSTGWSSKVQYGLSCRADTREPRQILVPEQKEDSAGGVHWPHHTQSGPG